MKMITAIVRPHALEVVRSALQEHGINGLTISEVKGFGRQKGHNELYRGAEYNVAFNPKLKLELVVDEPSVDSVIDVIRENAKSDRVGDGKIFVSNLESVVRIRTGETDSQAI